MEASIGAPATASAPGSPADIAARIDRLSINRLHVLAVALCAAAMFVDGLELTVAGVFATVFNAKNGVSANELALLLGGGGLGMAIGAPIFGKLGDKLGRRWTLTIALLFFGALSIGCGAAPGITWLTGARFLASFAIGAFQPLMAAYLVDVLPPRSRGRFILYTSVVAGFGSATPMFIARHFMGIVGFPIEGWRMPLYIGGAGAILAGLLILWLLPESPRWLAAVGKAAKADLLMQRFERWAKNKPSAIEPAHVSPPPVSADAETAGSSGEAVRLGRGHELCH